MTDWLLDGWHNTNCWKVILTCWQFCLIRSLVKKAKRKHKQTKNAIAPQNAANIYCQLEGSFALPGWSYSPFISSMKVSQADRLTNQSGWRTILILFLPAAFIIFYWFYVLLLAPAATVAVAQYAYTCRPLSLSDPKKSENQWITLWGNPLDMIHSDCKIRNFPWSWTSDY